jgi:hypothetical protein
MEPVLSVIMPTYNRRAYIVQALESVLSQAPAAAEILVIDDGSTDGTVEFLRGLAEPRVRLLAGPHHGISGARNAGLDAARGRYLAFLDSDDAWCPGRVNAQVALLDAQPDVDLAYGPHFEGDEDLRPMLLPGVPWQLKFADWLTGCRLHLMDAIFRCRCLAEIRFDERFAVSEDWDFWLQVMRAGCRPAYVPHVTGIIRHHHTNTTRSITINACYRLKVAQTWQTERGVQFPSDLATTFHYGNAIVAIRRGLEDAALDEYRQGFAGDPAPWDSRLAHAIEAALTLAASPFCTDPDALLRATLATLPATPDDAVSDDVIVRPDAANVDVLLARLHLIRARDAFITGRVATGQAELAVASVYCPQALAAAGSLLGQAALLAGELGGGPAGERLLAEFFDHWPYQDRRLRRVRAAIAGWYYYKLGLRAWLIGDRTAGRYYLLAAARYRPAVLADPGVWSMLSGWAAVRQSWKGRQARRGGKGVK